MTKSWNHCWLNDWMSNMVIEMLAHLKRSNPRFISIDTQDAFWALIMTSKDVNVQKIGNSTFLHDSRIMEMSNETPIRALEWEQLRQDCIPPRAVFTPKHVPTKMWLHQIFGINSLWSALHWGMSISCMELSNRMRADVVRSRRRNSCDLTHFGCFDAQSF